MTLNDISGSPGTSRATAAKIATATSEQDRPKTTAQTAIPIGFATKYLAAGGAAFDWAVVKRCPFCELAHRHIWLEPNAKTIERNPSCAPHRSYTVQVVDVVPAARRSRGAA